MVAIFVVSAVVFASAVDCRLTCVSCDLRHSSGDVFTALGNKPGSQVCVWGTQIAAQGLDILNILAKLFSASNKTIKHFGNIRLDTIVKSCRHNILLLNNLTTCHGILAQNTPLKVHYSFYVVVDGGRDFEEGELTRCSGQFGVASVMFVFLHNGQVFSLSSPIFRPRVFTASGLPNITDQPALKVNNLRGLEVNVASYHFPPYVILEKYNGSEVIRGIEGDILTNLTDVLNFTVKVVELKDKKGWGDYVNGSWVNGLMQAVADGDADLAVCNVWMASGNDADMEFGPYTNLVSFTMVVPRPRLIYGSWTSLVNIFQGRVWVGVLGSYFICTFCYWLFCSISSSRKSISPTESMLTMFGILTLTSWYVKRVNTSVRQLIFWWSVFVLVMSATYSSSIAAQLTLPRFEPRIDTTRQLVQQGFNWFDEIYNIEAGSFFFNKANRWHVELESKFKFVPLHRRLEALRSGKFAFTVQRWGESLLFFNIEGLDNELDLKEMRIMKENTIDNIYNCFGFSKMTPLFYTFQDKLLQLRQTGLMGNWIRKNQLKHLPEFVKQLQTERDDVKVNKLRQLSIVNLSPAFLILTIGLMLSSLLFVVEMLTQMYNKDLTKVVYFNN